jgi:TolB-like protein/tetratricopeptide (TPR) repeat protein
VVSAEYLAGVTATGLTQTLVASTSSSRTGTQMYMAPELLSGRTATVQSDLYALGVVLYQFLTGDFTRPVTMDWAEEISEPLLKEDLRRCFASKPEERFGSATDLARNLRSLSERRTTRAMAQKEAFDRGAARVASLAVLPFVNMSPDPENEFLSDGIAEDLIMALSRVPGLRVPARTSAFAFKGKTQDIRVIGQMLTVETVLEGSVRKAGNRLRVTAQLINVADGFHLWSERYDREMQDVFAIQDDITQAIMGALKVRLGGVPAPAPVKRYTPNTDTYQLYLKGRFCIAKYTPEGFATGLRLLEQALNLEPNYPLPYVSVARAYVMLSHFGHLPPREGVPKSQAAAVRALELDETLGEAHTQLAMTRMFDWNWPGAEQEFRRALELDPSNSDAHHAYGVFLWAMGRLEEALGQQKQAVELDPLSLVANHDLAFPLISLGRCEEAVEHAGKMISLEPSFWGGYRVRALARQAVSRWEESVADLQKAVALGGGPFMLGHLGYSFGRLGRVSEAQQVLAELNQLAQQRYVPALCWSLVYLGLGEREQLLAWWDRAIQNRDGMLPFMRVAARTWFPENADMPVLLKQIGL